MRKLLLAALLVAAGATWALWPSANDAPAIAHSEHVLLDRFWIDHIPKKPTDKFDIFVMLDEPAAGVFQNTSAYEGDYSAFEWSNPHRGDDRYEITMLQQGKRHRMSIHVADEGCRGFDYCMKIKGAPRGSARYVSMKDWVIDAASGVQPEALRQQVLERLGVK